MPKQSPHVLTWSEANQHYELREQGHLQLCFRLDDKQEWLDWLSEHTSFAFRGQHGPLSVIKEMRQRGTGYWYAYRTVHQQTHKCYLGPKGRVTLERLEQEALALSTRGVTTSPQLSRDVRLHPLSLVASGRVQQDFIETKWTAPRLPVTFTLRTRLFQSLDRVLAHRLLVVSASAGSGKTTLLSAWASQSSQRVAWLSLDALDRDPFRFWVSVIMALRRGTSCLSEPGAIALSMLSEAQPPPLTTLLTTLINDIVACSQEIILILDDSHLIEDQAILDALLFLLDHLPSNLHLILSGRVEPALPLARWRMHGYLVEIRESDLRFTQEEASHFLRLDMHLPLSEEEVELLENRTEGWIAGLQLAALSLQNQQYPSAFVQNFTGRQHALIAYMQEEILQRQPQVIQDFLLHIAILDRMNAALCQAVTGEPKSQEVLEMLERRHLFVVSLDEPRQWFRLHSLLRDALLARLQATQPARISALHQQAAHWYDSEGYIHDAIAHALAAQYFSLAVAVIERTAQQLWIQGEAMTVAAWVLALPDDIIGEHLDMTLTSVLHLFLQTQSQPESQRTEALMLGEQIMVRVEQVLSTAREGVLALVEASRWYHRLRVLLDLVVMNEMFQQGDMRQVRFIAQQLRPLVADEFVAWKWVPMYGLFVSSQWLGDAVLLLPDLLALKQQAFQERDAATAMVVMCWIAAALLSQGELRLLQQECIHVQALLEQSGRQAAVGAYPAFDLSFLYYARNQIDKAEACLQNVIAHAQRWQDMNLLVWSYGTIVPVLIAARKRTEAEQTLAKAQRLMRQNGYTVYEPMINAAQVALWLAQDNMAAARAWAEHYRFNPQELEFTREEEYLMLIRVSLHQRSYERAFSLLVPLLTHTEQVRRVRDVIHLLALQVVACSGMGKIAQAKQTAIRLVMLTQDEGFIRVYLDAGEAMQQVLKMLHETPDATVSRTFLSRVLAAFEQEQHRVSPILPISISEHHAAMRLTQNGAIAPHEPFEPLSRQEHRVFQLLVAGRTYAEIAQELIVSLNTVKTQVSSIYRKLGVSRRAEASAVAQQLQLL